MASSVYAAIQPPSEEGEKPVTVLVTGFGVRTLLLFLLPLSDTLKVSGSCWELCLFLKLSVAATLYHSYPFPILDLASGHRYES